MSQKTKIFFNGLPLDDALRGVMAVPAPDDAKLKPKKRKTTKKPAKRKK